MSYTALYRKFRPQEFEDVKGQEHIVTTLKNQIKADRIGHAYLFCGTRGTGKTTVAKIFAKAVNCEHPVDGSPCGKCPACQGIAAGTSMNVIEIEQWCRQYPSDPGRSILSPDGRQIQGLYYRRGAYALGRCVQCVA